MRPRHPIVAILALAGWAILCAPQGCVVSGSDGTVASPSVGIDFGVSRGAADASVQPDPCSGRGAPENPFDPRTCPLGDADLTPCVGLGCAVDRGCEGGTTTVSGTVYDPAGRNPLPNVMVFLPSDPQGRLPAISSGTAACGTCAGFLIGQFVAIAITDTAGHFTLHNAPSGHDIPIVFQAGKWRREVFLPEVRSCGETVVPAPLSRLPRNQAEGDMPQLALLAGGCDRLACFMSDLGVDASEFTGPEGEGRVHVYRGAGPGPTLSNGTAADCTGDAGPCPLWSEKERLEKYDALLLGCECGENNQTKTDMIPLHAWLDTGGEVLAIHSQRTWFKNGPPDFRGIASWTDGASSRPFDVDTTYIDGRILRDWLVRTNASGPDGSVLLDPAQVSTSVSATSPNATAWIFGDTRPQDPNGAAPPRAVKAFSFLTPVGGNEASNVAPLTSTCGRAIFTDIHPGGADIVDMTSVPAGCPPRSEMSSEMSAEEKVLEFLFFDLTNCFTPILSGKNAPTTWPP